VFRANLISKFANRNEIKNKTKNKKTNLLLIEPRLLTMSQLSVNLRKENSIELGIYNHFWFSASFYNRCYSYYAK